MTADPIGFAPESRTGHIYTRTRLAQYHPAEVRQIALHLLSTIQRGSVIHQPDSTCSRHQRIGPPQSAYRARNTRAEPSPKLRQILQILAHSDTASFAKSEPFNSDPFAVRIVLVNCIAICNLHLQTHPLRGPIGAGNRFATSRPYREDRFAYALYTFFTYFISSLLLKGFDRYDYYEVAIYQGQHCETTLHRPVRDQFRLLHCNSTALLSAHDREPVPRNDSLR